MAFKNNLRQIRVILYRLKRNFGLTLTIWHPVTSVSNLETGVLTRAYTISQIKHAIILPTRSIRDFVYDLSYIAANKNFTYGGYFDPTERWVIIDVKDLPDGFEITNNDYVVWEARQYTVKEIQLAEHNQGYLLKVKEFSGLDDIEAAYISSGTLSPNAIGNYYKNGTENSEDAYQKLNGKFWLWYDGAQWVVSSAKGVTGTDYWEKGDATITGAYTPAGGATGSLTMVAA